MEHLTLSMLFPSFLIKMQICEIYRVYKKEQYIIDYAHSLNGIQFGGRRWLMRTQVEFEVRQEWNGKMNFRTKTAVVMYAIN